MGLFNKVKRSDRDYDLLAGLKATEKNGIDLQTKVSPVLPDTDDLDFARISMEEFASDLRDSAARQQSAIKRITTLNSAISKMELDLKSLRRVQADNRNLGKQVSELESKLSQKTSWANELDAKLNDIERRHSETRSQLEEAKGSLAAGRDQESALLAQNASNERTIRALTAKFQTAEDKIGHNDNRMEKMQDRLDTQNAELAQRERQLVELRNTLDELSEKYASKSSQSDQSTVELKNLRADYADLKAKHVEMSGQLENVRYDLQTQKNLNDDSIQRRDEENLALKTRIDQLDTQVRIKENMATHLDQEFISLRNALVNERDRAEALDDRLRLKSEEFDQATKSLHSTKTEYEKLNTKFATTLEDFEMLRKINQQMREKLEKYALISGVSSGQSLLNSEIYSKDKAVDDSVNVMRLKKNL